MNVIMGFAELLETNKEENLTERQLATWGASDRTRTSCWG